MRIHHLLVLAGLARADLVSLSRLLPAPVPRRGPPYASAAAGSSATAPGAVIVGAALASSTPSPA